MTRQNRLLNKSARASEDASTDRRNRFLTVASLFVAVGLMPFNAHAQLTYVEQSTGLETPTMGNGGTDFQFSDVNGDGHVDIVSIGDHGSPNINSPQHGVMVWFGDGTGNWSVFQMGNFGYGGVALGDVNGDGLMDVGYGLHHNYSNDDLGDQIFEVALGDGTGHHWTAYDDGLATNGETWGMFGTDFADVDNDGDLDVGSISFGAGAGLHVYLNNGDGTWTQSWGFLGGNSSLIFKFADFNGDGNADFASGHGGGTTYLGDGQGGFTLADGDMGATWRFGVAVGDVNDDGRDDLAFARGGISVFSWVGPGHWQRIPLRSGGGFDFAQIADMDVDGHGDVIGFGSGSSQQVRVFGGDGDGGWTEIASIDAPTSRGSTAFSAGTDVDHNGHPDLVIISEEGGRPPWTQGTNRPRLFAEDSVPDASFVYAKSPRGGETWIAGSVRFIDWHAAAANGESTMSIDLSQRGPNGPWTTIAADVPMSDRFQYHTPADLRNSDTNYLRFRMGDVTEVTPAPFTIIGVEGGCIRNPQWQCDGDVDGDGQVNPVDSGLVQAAFGSADQQDLCNYDMDCDAQINPVDAGIVQSLFGTCETPRDVCP